MLPLLRFAADRQEHSLREAIEALTAVFGLTDAEQKQLLPSGIRPIFDDRVSWARSYMKQAGLLESPRRGYFRITQRGLDVLAKNPSKIDLSFLSQYSEFVKFRSLRKH
ncbi:restriction endonuclease, partial [Candidatus Methylacidiphilum fumarolicum]